MTDATSQSGIDDSTPAIGDDQDDIEQMLTDAITAPAEGAPAATAGDDKPPAGKDSKGSGDDLGDSGKRALQAERQARRDAEKQLGDLRTRLQQFEDRDKTELQKAIERAEAAEKGATSMRVANARLMAAAIHNLPPDLIDLLGDGTEEEIDAKAKLLAEKLAAAAPAPTEVRPSPALSRPVEALTPGARPASDGPADGNALFRDLVNRKRGI